jgi:hypothetical protein
MSVPQLQVLYRRNGDIFFGWIPLSKSEAKTYNLYSSATPAGVYSLFKSGIQNVIDKTYKGKVCALVKDVDVPIPLNSRYYFKLTAVDASSVESNINLSPFATVYPPTVDPHHEGEAEEANTHNYGWVEQNQRWEKFLLTPDGKLSVDANVEIGDITLENVKIAALADNTTLQYLLVDNDRRLVVKQDPTSISRFRSYEEASNVPTTETIVYTYTNAGSFFIEKILCTGTADALFKLKINGTTISALRNSWNNRNVVFDFSDKSIQCSAASTVTVTVKHNEKVNQSYETSMFGFTY